MNDKDSYIFSQPFENVIEHLDEYWNRTISTSSLMNPLYQRWLKAFYLYYGFQFINYGFEAGLQTIGDQGEFIGYAPNQFRNVIKTTLGILTQNRIAFDATAISDNIEDINIGDISNTILENYLYSKRNEKELKNSVEAGTVLGTSLGGWFWDDMVRIVDIDLDENPIWEGDLKFDYFLPFDFRMDPFIEKDEDIRWITIRRKKNRHQLIGKYPHLKEELLKVESIPKQSLGNDFVNHNDMIWEKELYHVNDFSLLKGRMIRYAGKVKLIDNKNPYCNPREMNTGMPLARFRPDILFGSSYGHSVSFDLIPSQEYLGIVQSVIASSVNSLGTPNIVLPSANSIDNVEELPNGLRYIFYKPVEGAKDGGMPQTLNLLQLSPDLIRERDLIIRDIEQVSAINSALRGNPQPGIQAASAIALLTTQAQTYNSSLEKNYIEYNENLAKKLLHCCSIFMENKQIVDIVGVSQKYSAEQFTGAALSRIKDIKFIVGNFLSKSLAGRLTMAEQLLNAQQINSTEYAQILNTGQVSPILKEKASEENLINWENEQLLRGAGIYVETTENHLMHILKHAEVLKIPQVKTDIQLAEKLRNHIVEHQDEYYSLSKTNPQLLALITGSPIPPVPSEPGEISGEGGSEMIDGEAPTDGQPPKEIPMEQAAQDEGDTEALSGRAMRRAQTELSKVQMAS